jgi:DNA adenine methylase
MNFSPIIKWSGSKRSQAPQIIKNFCNYNTYYEPFLGGGSILYALAPIKAICGDICAPLIEFWKVLRDSPLDIYSSYNEDWNRLQKDGYTVYYEIRDRFNREPNPYDLFFLSRTCVNGLIRFNKEGKFNNSLHYTRKGISPSKIKSLVLEWSERIANVNFVSGDYNATSSTAKKGDLIYLDPPYFNTKGRYFGTIDYITFYDYIEKMNSKGVKIALSFDGIRGNKDYQVKVPSDLFKRHILIKSGDSTFTKVMNKKAEKVFESLYLNF